MNTQDWSLERDLGAGAAAGRSGGVSRRSFMGGMGAMMAGAALAAAGSKSAYADEADVAAEVEEEAADESESAAEAVEETEEAAEETGSASSYLTLESPTGWTGTPEDLLALGTSTMPLEDLNAYRKAYIDAQTDYTQEDGTVIPACYVKVRELINTYGYGVGSTYYDGIFDDLMNNFSEDDCQAFIDMPMGVAFTAYEMAAEEDRDIDECTEICERLADAGYLRAFDGHRGRCYNQVNYVPGCLEYHLTEFYESDNALDVGVGGLDLANDLANSGAPTIVSVPIDASVTSDGTILPFDDLKEKVKSKNICAIGPCFCRYRALAGSLGHENIPSFEDFATGEYEDYFSEVCDQRVETCIMTGDEAQYWIEQGMARQITGEQAAEYLQRSVDDGFILETTFEKESEGICSCHLDSCLYLQTWMSLGDAETVASANSFKQINHYTLEVDPDLCIACGLCVDRCPMHCITINDDGWAEAGANCFRCGQCAYVCPQDARHLVLRDESELAPLPADMIEMNNILGAYRFETGQLAIPEA